MTSSINKFGLIAFALMILTGVTFFILREDVPPLHINEIMAFNISCCPDSVAGQPEFDDWIEIYNAGRVPVDIGGMYFSQDLKEPLSYKVPVSNPSITTIQPNSHLVLWADGTPAQGVLHLDFKLDQDGEYVGLFDKSGRLIDSVKFKAQRENISLGRSSDGNKIWKEFSVPTPGRSN